MDDRQVEAFTRFVTALGEAVDIETARLNRLTPEQAQLSVGDQVRWGGLTWTVRAVLEGCSWPTLQLIENGPRKRVRNAPRASCTRIG